MLNWFHCQNVNPSADALYAKTRFLARNARAVKRQLREFIAIELTLSNCAVRPLPFGVSRRHNSGTVRHRDVLELPFEGNRFSPLHFRSPRVRLFKRLSAPYLM